MIGFAIIEWTRRQEEMRAYIQTIEVAPESRGLGVGRELLARCEGSAFGAGAALIRLHVDPENSAAIHLYEAQGYACEGREENYYPLGRSALIYRKSLNPA
jgi:ribosomal protein S18 acetylase RimI-like enzyme